MSALETWNSMRLIGENEDLKALAHHADAAIAELQATVERLKVWEEIAAQRQESVELALRAAEQFKAELAALKAQRCDDCECASEPEPCPDMYWWCSEHASWWKVGESCSRWKPREEETP